MTIIFAPNTRLPFNIIKGSPEHRTKLAEGYTRQFAQKLQDSFMALKEQGRDYDSISVDELRNIIDSVLPAKIDYDLVDSCNHAPGLDMRNNRLFENGKPVFLINKPLLKLPVLEKNWYGMTVHEIRHFMDVITQPSAIIKGSINIPKLEETLDFYRKTLYTQEPLTKIKKSEIKNFLEQFNTEEKIAVLKYCRVQLQWERNAYSTASQITNTLNAQKDTKLGYLCPQSSPEEYFFDEKIEYIEKLLSKELREEKKNIRKISGWKKLINQIFFS